MARLGAIERLDPTFLVDSPTRVDTYLSAAALAELTQKLADGRINLRGLSASVIGKQFLAYSALDSLDDPNKVC